MMALLKFRNEKCDFAILETGIGGRLDATNFIKKPICTVITSIGLDHTELLGDTLEKIAFEKAGIMKPGVPCVVGPTCFQVAFKLKAKETHSELIRIEDTPTYDMANNLVAQAVIDQICQ